jgi:5-methyltetrahydropteroyltriglutamate--homocysteine methyltransferase
MASLDGAELYETSQGIQFHGVQTKSESVRFIGKLDFPRDHPFLDDFKFVRDNTNATAKMTIPAPPVLHFRGGRKSISEDAYPDIAEFFDDLGKTFRKAVHAFYDAGCRYLQLDDTVWAYLCSPDQLQRARERGEDVAKLPGLYARVINHAIAERPADMTITTHVCRGNFRSTWVSEGGYEPVAEVLFNAIDYDGYFLEYDTDRAGGFEPLRFLPKGKKQVVLGLVTSKSGTLEKEDDIKRRIDEAAKFAPLGQLCLSPQCGFASTEEGNILTDDEQWAKLALVVSVAGSIWGR